MARANARLRDAIAGLSPLAQLRAFIQTYLEMVSEEPTRAELLTIELRQSSKFMKEYDNPQFADFLRMLGGIIADGQARAEIDPSIPSHIVARMIFGMLDELSLAWVLTRQPVKNPASSSPPTGTRPKKFDIVRAADWAVALVTTGLDPTRPGKPGAPEK